MLERKICQPPSPQYKERCLVFTTSLLDLLFREPPKTLDQRVAPDNMWFSAHLSRCHIRKTKFQWLEGWLFFQWKIKSENPQLERMDFSVSPKWGLSVGAWPRRGSENPWERDFSPSVRCKKKFHNTEKIRPKPFVLGGALEAHCSCPNLILPAWNSCVRSWARTLAPAWHRQEPLLLEVHRRSLANAFPVLLVGKSFMKPGWGWMGHTKSSVLR